MAKRKNGMPRSLAFGIGRPMTAEDLDAEKRRKKAFEELRKIDEELGIED